VSKAPALPLYTKDFDTDERVLLMSLEEEGAYNRLIRHQWREGSIPGDLRSLARILRITAGRARKLWSGVLKTCFDRHPSGRLVNRKVETVREGQRNFHEVRSEAGMRGAEVRWGKKRRSEAGMRGARPENVSFSTEFRSEAGMRGARRRAEMAEKKPKPDGSAIGLPIANTCLAVAVASNGSPPDPPAPRVGVSEAVEGLALYAAASGSPAFRQTRRRFRDWLKAGMSVEQCRGMIDRGEHLERPPL